MVKRVLLSLAVIIAMLSMQGCNKTWSQYFNSPDDLNDWELQAMFWPEEAYVTVDGLYIDGVVVHAPFGFEADFTMEIVFDLLIKEPDFLSLLEIILSGGEDANFTNYFISTFVALGDPFENYWTYEASPPVLLSSGDLVPGLNRDGRNSYKFIKEGNHVQVYMNDAVICDNELTSYPYNKFFPSINVDASSPDQIAIKSMKVVYSGDSIVYPRP